MLLAVASRLLASDILGLLVEQVFARRCRLLNFLISVSCLKHSLLHKADCLAGNV